MKKYIYLLLVIISLIPYSSFAKGNTTIQNASLSGRITDKVTGATIPGVIVYVPDLKTGTVSGVDGTYKMEHLPSSKILIQISFIGYKTIIEMVDLSITTVKDFALESTVTEMQEIVVTGLSQGAEKNRTPSPMTIVSKTVLLQNASTNIIDALAKQPGVSQITTGSGISKPVIRGLGFNRVVVVNDGIRQEGQQWGNEHGIEIDEYSVSKVEILKGPASLSYGSDAIAGVINMITDPTLPQGQIGGGVIANYQTNNGSIGYSANLAGNLKGFIWNMRYSGKMAHAYQNKYDGYVFNSGFKENTISGIIGLNRSWGYSHVHFSSYDLGLGIVEGERDSLTGKFLKMTAMNDSVVANEIAQEKDDRSYSFFNPYQKIKHYKVVLNNSFIFGNGSFKAILGFQQNQRQEYGDVLNPKHYGLYFLMNTINYDIRYVLPEKNQYSVSFGTNGMYQISQNKGIEFLIPEYNLFDIGVFSIIRKSFDKLDVSGGIRYDSRTQHGSDLYINANGEKVEMPDSTSYHQFQQFNADYNGVSGSIGAAYQISKKMYGKINASRGYRAPNIGEIGANGVHEGTLRYEIGNPQLKAETSFQLDVALGLNTEHISAEVDLFNNSISHFIFSRKLNSANGSDSITQGFSTFQFVSGDANLSGGEISVDIHPHPIHWLHFENSFSYVRSIQKDQPDSTKYLPFTPAPKLQSEIRADLRKIGKAFVDVYFKAEVEHYFEQNNVYSAYITETKTKAYTLVNVGAGTDLVKKNKTICSLYISVNNITDLAYQSHLSRLKYAAINYSTGRAGVYNMGRNISFKMIIPLRVVIPSGVEKG